MMAMMVPGENSPTRVAAQVVSGIGFLGGGVILREGTSVRGLNTAATLWCAAAIGSLTGYGLLDKAYLGALAVVGANFILKPLFPMLQEVQIKNNELLIVPNNHDTFYEFKLICAAAEETILRTLLVNSAQNRGMILNAISSHKLAIDRDNTEDRVEVNAELLSCGRHDLTLEELVGIIKEKINLTAVSWKFVE
jgi:putative Mg2+ transporter-C (MgtC) family protein